MSLIGHNLDRKLRERVRERAKEMICNWCGDTMKEGIYEIHKCLDDKEGE